MKEFITSQQDPPGPEAIKNLFAHLIESPVADSDIEVLERDAELAWQNFPELEIRQGNLTGSFDRSSVAYYLGSLPGYSIFVNAKTDTGPKDIQLLLTGNKPAFDILPAKPKKPALNVEPLSEDYATLPIEFAFDWKSIINAARASRNLGTEPLYLVAFRSTLRPEADTETIMEHDRRAHEAALESPALIHYFGGIPNELGQALSFCLWENAADAKAISNDRRHVEATALVSQYESYSIEKHNVLHDDKKIVLAPISA